MLLWILFFQRFGWNMDFWFGKNRPGYAKQRYSYFSLIRSIKCNYWLMSNIEKRAFSMKITLVCPCMCKRDKTKCILVVLLLGGKIAKCGNVDPSWKWWFFPSTKTFFEHLSNVASPGVKKTYQEEEDMLVQLGESTHHQSCICYTVIIRFIKRFCHVQIEINKKSVRYFLLKVQQK